MGDVMYLNLTATDYGGLFTTVEVWIVFPAENTTTTSTTPHPILFVTSPTNTLWFTATGILVCALSVGVLYFCTKYWHSIDCVKTTRRKKPAGKPATENSKSEPDDKKKVKKKLESVNVKRPPGNPLFNKGNNSKPKGSNSVNSSVARSSVFESKTIPSQSSSQPSLNASVTSNDTSRNSLKPVSDVSFSSQQVNSNLYKAKEEQQSGDQGLLLDF